MMIDPNSENRGSTFILAADGPGPGLRNARAELGSRNTRRISPQFTAKNAAWLCRLRWMAVGFMTLLGTLGFAPEQLRAVGIRGEFGWSFLIAAALGCLNLGYLAHLQWIAKRNTLRQAEVNLRLQILADLVLVTVAIYFAGTTDTLAPVLYVFHIVLTCIFFPTRRSFVIVLLASALYGAVLVLELQGYIPLEGGIFLRTPEASFPGSNSELVRVATNFTTLFLVWLCVWYLAARLSSAIFRRDRELARSNEHLLRTQAERTRHMLRTTHELKAPFAAIHANTQLLINGYCGSITAEALTVIRRIADRSRRLSASIQNMLQLTNVQAVGTDALKWSDVDLGDLLKTTLDQLHPLALERGITLQVQLNSLVSYAPADHFLMLFSNILQNAILYSRRGGVVAVSCQENTEGQGRIAKVVIRDHGIGIPPQKLPRIFEEYYRTEEAVAHNKDSSGIGLAIVKTVAQALGITIQVESQLGAGTTFTLAIPLMRRDSRLSPRRSLWRTF